MVKYEKQAGVGLKGGGTWGPGLYMSLRAGTGKLHGAAKPRSLTAPSNRLGSLRPRRVASKLLTKRVI